jgi:hypothetical protein
MYTDAMARAMRSLDHHAPKGFGVQIIDNEHFITVKASEKSFFGLDHDSKIKAITYMVLVKKALEQNGAIVLLVREGGEEQL